MNRLTKQVLAFAIGCAAFIYLLGIAGSYEHAEQVVYSMPQEVYDQIKAKLGDEASQRAIASEYMANKAHYNSISE